MQNRQALPTEAGAAGDTARRLARAIGPVVQPANGTRIAADLLALGGSIADGRSTLRTVIAQAFADSANDLLGELERVYGLALERTDLSVAARQTRLLAKIRATRGGSPQAMLLAVRAIDPTATITEFKAGDNTSYPRGVFHWVLKLDPVVFANDEQRAQIEQLVAQMKPAHTGVSVVPSDAFLTDDPNSLTDTPSDTLRV
jgi:uncharacterized protein YmfQ (DUF2313 family)